MTVVNTNKVNIEKRSDMTYLRIDDDQGSRRKIESSWGEITLWVYTRKNSTIASGATTIGSTERAPDDTIELSYYLMTRKKAQCLWAYTQNKLFSTIASGATPIGSAGRAPDDALSWIMEEKTQGDFESIITTIGRKFYQPRWNNPNIWHIRIVKQGCDVWFSSCIITTKLECRGWNISWR
jgi:hypothetical protein